MSAGEKTTGATNTAGLITIRMFTLVSCLTLSAFGCTHNYAVEAISLSCGHQKKRENSLRSITLCKSMVSSRTILRASGAGLVTTKVFKINRKTTKSMMRQVNDFYIIVHLNPTFVKDYIKP